MTRSRPRNISLKVPTSLVWLQVADTPKPPAKDELQGAKPTLKSFEQDREAHHAVSSDADSKATEKLEQIAAVPSLALPSPLP